MDHKAVVKLCKEYGCCESCCLRYIGVKSPAAYEKPHEHILKFSSQSNGINRNEQPKSDTSTETNLGIEPSSASESVSKTEAVVSDAVSSKRQLADSDETEPQAKRHKAEVCVACLGILQTETWEQAVSMVKEVIEKKQYSTTTFAAALSAPVCTIYRERVISARLKAALGDYDSGVITALKESWKWSFGLYVAAALRMSLDSGKYAPLLVTVNIEYPDDLQELEILKTLSPLHFSTRAQQRKRFTLEFTRRSVSDALDDVSDEALAAMQIVTTGFASCVSVVACHEPVYLAGRYIKLSRWLPQTPWLIRGRRMVASSVQDAIFTPIARLYGMPMEDIEHRLKFMSAGREDVDVRCLGDGRPFAIEVSDPRRSLTAEELELACEEISKDKQVIVKRMVHVTKDDLVQLKKGEESKSKTYEALVVKLQPISDKTPLQFAPCPVTPLDIAAINKFAPTTLSQRTPLRVLHRRPLLTRQRGIYELQAEAVENHPTLLKIRLKTEAGTYVKEFVHGECGRTRPCLADALKPNKIEENNGQSNSTERNGEESQDDQLTENNTNMGAVCNTNGAICNNVGGMIKFDILALDVESVHLEWPIIR